MVLLCFMAPRFESRAQSEVMMPRSAGPSSWDTTHRHFGDTLWLMESTLKVSRPIGEC